MATANPKSVEWWKPQQSESAGKAAMLATDYKAASAWQPTASTAGSTAALLAHSERVKNLPPLQPTNTDASNSAAEIAFHRNNGAQRVHQASSSNISDKKALLAATEAVSGSRMRSGSLPTTVASYPDALNSRKNALNAATIAQQPAKRLSRKEQFGPTSTQSIVRNVAPEMYTEAPPISIEVEEQKRQDALRASAISMAKRMYDAQQAHINEVTGVGYGQSAAIKAQSNDHATSISAENDLKQQAMQYINLQEAAQKLAAERLAKIKIDNNAAFRDYYGYSKKQPRSRLSVRLGRRRSSSVGDMVDSDDEEQSRRIRSEMSLFNNQLAQVDAKKRQKDRDALLEAARRKVHAQLHDMDEKVFMETGKAPPSIQEEWQVKARAHAAAASEVRMENHGKVHIGGGRYLDQSAINAVAAARIQPTLDEITDKAERQRAKDEEIRLDQEERKREAKIEKEREAELKAEQKRIKSKLCKGDQSRTMINENQVKRSKLPDPKKPKRKLLQR